MVKEQGDKGRGLGERAATEVDPARASHYEVMATALHELLIETGVYAAEEVRRMLDELDSRTPMLGAKVIARAWVDPEYKEHLLADASAACVEIGIDVLEAKLVAVENTPDTHNVIVCTLCSCYPRMLLGWPPDWYKSRNYRSRVVNEPRAVLREFGTEIDDSVAVRVHDSNADLRYIVVPMRPEGTEGWTEEQLAEILTRDCMVGVTVPRVSV